MSVKVDEPIYQTEVVKVSEMPIAKKLSDESKFLVVQDSLSRQIAYKNLESQIAEYIVDDISEDFQTLVEKINYISSAIDSNDHQQDVVISQLSVKTYRQISSTASQLSSSLTYETDKKIQNEDEKFSLLKLFIDQQNLSAIRAETMKNTADIQSLNDKETTDIAQLSNHLTYAINTTAAHLSSAIVSQTATISTMLSTQLVHDYSELRQGMTDYEQQTDIFKADVNSKLSADKISIQNLIDAAKQTETQLEMTIERFDSLETELYGLSDDGQIQQLSDRIQQLSDELSNVEDIQIQQDNRFTTAISTLSNDVFDQLTALSVDDLGGLSEKVAVLSAFMQTAASMVSELDSKVTQLSAEISSLNIIETQTTGPFELKDESQYIRVNLFKAGYRPVSIVSVQLFDEHSATTDRCYARNRFITSDREGQIEFVKTTTDYFTALVTLEVAYQKIFKK